MNKLARAAALSAGMGLVPFLLLDVGPAYARGKDDFQQRCKRMVQQTYGVEPGKGRRGRTAGGASTYYSQIQTCVANGGRL